ncbi:MoxR family ATPase [Chitiniphilus purpureus]|uniref:MoxR family ATPase n=1 Tax=Chitiniphilus purpureus TaxID=2981137 RepID=A0ABY6DR13_9NEIS|nr:MoxR family ATPase [Chitiniphilus sp. CD1]UXY14353.1 MoxR family ATPase [Chitiniphilus sp. CD1]
MPLSFSPALAQLNRVLLGKEAQVRMALCCLLARGHLLLEDLPGVGKTTLAHALAATLGLRFQRVQFTSDLLPADLIGVSIYERDSGRFRFHHGPVFTQLLLADEINRAPPKTQSALLEAMEEHQVTVDGTSYPLPEPFFVIATQNPQHQIGTFPLPESQLDRFLMRLELGYPDGAAERAMLAGENRRELLAQLGAAQDPAALVAAQQQVDTVHVAGPLLDYVQALARATRTHAALSYGLSPRALLGLVAAARAWAWLDGRDHVIPEDVQAVFPGVAGHRLMHRASGRVAPEAALELLRTVAIP